MLLKTRSTRTLAALCTLAASCLASHAQAQCIGYTVAPGPGTFTSATNDLGLYADDGTTAVSFPFTVNFYGTAFSSATVSSNGTLQFTTNSASFGNNCLPTATFPGPTILPFWDDLYTASQADGLGIFTEVSGPSGSQVFVIEWRTTYCCTAGAPINDFELKFYEGQDHFDVVYSTPMGDRASATIGCQDGTGTFTQFICNTAGPVAGNSLRFSCVTASTAGACCNVAAGTCNVSTQAACVSPNTFAGIGSSCPSTCPQPGACCNVSTGVCTQTGVAGCLAPSTFSGVGVVCTPNPCVGACCNPTTGVCSSTGAAGCASPNTFQGLGLACLPNPCPQPPPPANDNCADVVTANAPAIPGIGGIVFGNNSTATTDGNASCTAGFKDVYFVFTPASGGDWQFDTCATTPSFDTMISIHSGCPADASTQLACNDDNCGLLSRTTAIGLSAGVQVVVRVGNFSSAGTGGVFTLTVGQLQNGACCNAGTGACTATATGAAGCPSGTTYQGIGTSCAVNLCPQPPTGACCLANTQTCSEIPSASCTQQGGTYQGDNTTCGAAPCPFGACCLSCVGCFVQTSAGCTGAGGTYQGDGTACGSVNCPSTGTNVVANGDFETASFSGWTQFGDLGFTAVTTGPWIAIDPHGGSNHAHFGPTGGIGGIQQSITANPGDHVTIAFWYACTGTNNSFSAIFDGQTLVSFVNDTAHPGYTLFVFQATATTANPTLRFECFNPPLYVYLDDIVACVSAGASGVCCRGATCSATVTSAAACSGSLIGGQNAGASFPTGASCNSGSTTAPCCYADYNKQSSITVNDIFDFLNDWFAGSPYANTGGTGAAGPLAVQNIFDFLNAWFAGGC